MTDAVNHLKIFTASATEVDTITNKTLFILFFQKTFLCNKLLECIFAHIYFKIKAFGFGGCDLGAQLEREK